MIRTASVLLFAISSIAALATEVPEYQAMRAARPDGRTVTVQNLILTRDAYRLTFQSGTFHFLAPLGERTFGAVFLGSGSYELEPATPAERRHLALVTGEKDLQVLTDSFDTLILLFADHTAEEILKQASLSRGSPDPRASAAYEEHLRRQKTKFQLNLHLRVLEDFLNGATEDNGVFLAALAGKKFAAALIAVDPLGIGNLAPQFGSFGGEETAFLSSDEMNGGFWYLSATKASAISGRGKPLQLLADAVHYTVETRITSRLEIEGTTTIALKPRRPGIRVLPIHILPKLRLKEASLGGVPAGIVQEEVELGRFARLFHDEVADADAALVFSKALPFGETVEVRMRYEGRDVLRSFTIDTYSVGARESWYPNIGAFTGMATYELTYRFPRHNDLVSVGQLVREEDQGGEHVSIWKSEAPMRIAGFNYGRFKKLSRRDDPSGIQIDVYFNPDRAKMADDTLVDAMNTARTATAFFGRAPYSPVSVTQQSQWNFGQSWPSLIYLPTTALTTSTERMEMFSDALGPHMFQLNEFAKMVGWHEFAHQWWGHLVGWQSYRDQWLSEGFAEFTAALVLQVTESFRKYADYWERRRDDILEKRAGVANCEAGAISQGFRLATRRSPRAAQAMIYAKGGYVLHMLRMMMRDPAEQNPDRLFIAMMHDFVSEYAGKNPSTADFQKIVERHMTPRMDLAGTGTMDYFFSEWVHGTEIPRFRAALTARPTSSGKYRINGTVSQEGVSQDFRVMLPLYLDFGGDQLAKIGGVRLVGSTTQAIDFELPLPREPKRVLVNAVGDVLARK